MNFDVAVGASNSLPDHEQEADRRRRFTYLKRELSEYRPDIPEADLRDQVTSWLVLAETVAVDSGREHVDSELSALRKDYPMYRTRRHESGVTAFPDRCEGCEHYGIACPVLTDNDMIAWRHRIQETAEDPETYRREMREYATESGCQVIHDALDVIEQKHDPLLQYGQLLLMQVEERILFDDESEAVTRALANMELGDVARDLNLDLDGDLETVVEVTNIADADSVEAAVDDLSDSDAEVGDTGGGG